jgi:hypothetical protein
LHGLNIGARGDADHAVETVFWLGAVDLCHVSLQSRFSLVTACTAVACGSVYVGARVGLDLEVLRFDVCLKSFLFAKSFVAWREAGAVVFGGVDIAMTLQTAGRGEALAAARPVADMSTLSVGIGMGIVQVALEVVFARKRLVAAVVRAGKRTFVVVAAHVGIETAGTVEALAAAVDIADVVPLAAGLAVGAAGAIVGEVDLVVARVGRMPVGVGRVGGARLLGGRGCSRRGCRVRGLAFAIHCGRYGVGIGRVEESEREREAERESQSLRRATRVPASRK